MANLPTNWIIPEWPCPSRVRAVITTRSGGVSSGNYASMNLGMAVGDRIESVNENRRRLMVALPSPPKWLQQVHGNQVVKAQQLDEADRKADAAVTTTVAKVCAVTVADCLPVLLCDQSGQVVAVAHAGWRGLCAGIIENTVSAMERPGRQLLAYLGPAIGPLAFEVGDEVRTAFVECDAQAASAFRRYRHGKWLGDLFELARQRLRKVGVSKVFGGQDCTYSDPKRFFSHRRDKVSGRMAALIWISPV